MEVCTWNPGGEEKSFEKMGRIKRKKPTNENERATHSQQLLQRELKEKVNEQGKRYVGLP